jgi:hypothetical protein
MAEATLFHFAHSLANSVKARPDMLNKHLDSLFETKRFEKHWKAYVRKHRSDGLYEEDWEDGYLPADEDANKELKVPRPPVGFQEEALCLLS